MRRTISKPGWSRCAAKTSGRVDGVAGTGARGSTGSGFVYVLCFCLYRCRVGGSQFAGMVAAQAVALAIRRKAPRIRHEALNGLFYPDRDFLFNRGRSVAGCFVFFGVDHTIFVGVKGAVCRIHLLRGQGQLEAIFLRLK